MSWLVSLIVSTLAIFIAGYILPGVHINNITTAVVLAIVLAVLNAIVKPILVVLTIPVTILTLGLFLLVINALIIILASYMVDGFKVDGWLYALLFSIVISFLKSVLTAIAE